MQRQKKNDILVSPRQAISLVAVGIIVGAHWLLFYASVKVSNMSICLTGMASISLFTAFTEPFIEKRRIRGYEVALGLLVLCGLALVAGFESGHRLGLSLAIGGALLAAIFPVFNRRFVTSGLSSQSIVLWEMPGASLIALLVLPMFGSFNELLSWRDLDWLCILLLAIVCTVFAHGFHIHLLKRVSAYASNLAINFEPVYGILLGAWIFSEHKNLHPAFYVGAIAIFIANLIHVRVARR